jgi:mannose-1-phosphate guanylyltransferase
MKVMLLCAGEGTRLRPYTLKKPKPAIPFLGAPLVSYSMSLAEELKVTEFVMNTYHLPQELKSTVTSLRLDYKVNFIEEKWGLLGSGGGIHNAKSFFEKEDDFLVMNGDEVILPQTHYALKDALKEHRWTRAIATLMVMPHPEVGKKFGGAWTKKGSQQVELFSKTSPSDEYEGHHFVGVMILSHRVFKYFKQNVEEENILYETLTKAMQAGEKVVVQPMNCLWFETGNPNDFLEATSTLLPELERMKSEKNSAYWKTYLSYIVRRYNLLESLVEEQDPQLQAQLKKFWKEHQIAKVNA